jgi:hypothetical protein
MLPLCHDIFIGSKIAFADIFAATPPFSLLFDDYFRHFEMIFRLPPLYHSRH